MQTELFDSAPALQLAAGAIWLPGFALAEAELLLGLVEQLCAAAPWRQMRVPGGKTMSVAMSNCGAWGWVSDTHGYRYSEVDPLDGRPWPPMPAAFADLARRAAAQAGFAGFEADACLINRYLPGSRLALHQDRDERDFAAPIVSVSLGLPARFCFGGPRRGDPVQTLRLLHGDVLVWGGPARLYHHGVLALQAGQHPLLGARRINLTLRRAG